jgi:hypothetical protein
MRFALKRDRSHRSIADALRAVGADVLEGFECDLLVRFRNRAYLIECKAPDQVAKRAKTETVRESAMREKQVKLKAIFGEQYLVVFTSEGALRAVGAV